MVTVTAEYSPAYFESAPSASSIIAQPNQSADWQANKQILIALGILSLIIATFFLVLGAWVILPFAGLEMAVLTLALAVVCRRLNQRHILHFSDQLLLIEKGIRFPQKTWQLPREKVFVSVERAGHPLNPLQLRLCCHSEGCSENIPIGNFLNREESLELLEAIRRHGLSVRNDSSVVSAKL